MTQKIQNRYASAVHSSNLAVDGKTYMSDSDTLGAMGLADKALTEGRRIIAPDTYEPVRPAPLAVSLERLFSGDNRAAYDIVRTLAEMAHEHSFKIDCRIKRVQCVDLARACLAWHRDGTCKPCEGRGYQLIPGTKTLSERECPECRGSRKMQFERQFRPEWRELARWMVSEMTRASGYAGPAAMRALAPQLEL
jgi:hypothetical protein